jgi:hypothetical protein
MTLLWQNRPIITWMSSSSNSFTILFEPPPARWPRHTKFVVIDAVDECVNLEVVSSFIKLVLKSASEIPLKIFISSRDEYWIRKAFKSGDNKARISISTTSRRTWSRTISASISRRHWPASRMMTVRNGPCQSNFPVSSQRSGTLFIYAATAVRYIANGGELYKSRLSEMAIQGLESVTEFQTDIDFLYIHILGKACEAKQSHEVAPMRDLVSIIIFLRNPLPMECHCISIRKECALIFVAAHLCYSHS